MKLLVWSIRQGGGQRRERIAAAIVAHEPDLVALIEFVPSTAEPLLAILRDAGLRHRIATERSGFGFALCVLSRAPIVSPAPENKLLEQSGLWLRIFIPSESVGDFNTGASPADGRLRNYGDVDRFVAIRNAGFNLLPTIRSCSYSHELRDEGVSDHSALSIEIDGNQSETGL